MVLEHAILSIKDGRSHEFEAAFERAKTIIESMPGFIDLELKKCIEDSSKFLFLVNWETLEVHTIGFRQSPKYKEWKALLHHFYEPFPEVEHFI